MSCENNVCGIGNGNLPQPGDPDNNISLSARRVYGGILVSWSYPVVNGHAVAYTEVYRNSTNDSASAIKLENAGGSSYYDRLNPSVETDYYYWIEVVSIRGSRGARIGPTSATAYPIQQQTLEGLTGLIDEGLLAETLRTHISGITQNHEAIMKEIEDRTKDNKAFQDALAAVQSESGEAMSYLLQETTLRKDGDAQLFNQVNALALSVGQALGAIVEERNLRVTKDQVLAEDLLTIKGRVGNAEGLINTETRLRVENDSVLYDRYNDVSGRVGKSEGYISDIINLKIASNSVLITRLNSIGSAADNAKSAVNTLETSLANGTHALAKKVTTVEATLNGNVATGQVGLTAEVNEATKRVNVIWSAVTEVNGLVGGFGITNDGRIVEAGFDVDRFWIGRTGPTKVKPFIIEGDTVYLNKARIRNADIDTLKIAGNSVMVGTYDQGYGNSVGAYGSTVLIGRTIYLGDNNSSGLIVSGTVSFNSGENASVGFQIRINGQVVGDQRCSAQGGYGYIIPVSGFGGVGASSAYVELIAYSPSGGAGAGKPFNIGASTMSIMGGKR